MAVIKGTTNNLQSLLQSAGSFNLPSTQTPSKTGVTLDKPLLGSPTKFAEGLKNATELDWLNAQLGINPQSVSQPSQVATTPTPTPTTKTAAIQTKATTTPVKTATTPAAATPTVTPTPAKMETITMVNQAGQKTEVPADKFFDYQNQGWKAEETSAATTPTATTPAVTTTKETPTTAVQKEKETSSKVVSLLNQGYSTPENIAAASGLTVDEVNNYLSSNESASYMLKTNQYNDEADTSYKEYIAKLDSITNGTFALTEDEQADVKYIEDLYARMRENQITANKNYEGAVTTGEIRSGREEFMNQISSGIQKQAIDDGIQKVKDIESEAASKVREYKAAVRDKNYKAAAASYEATIKYLDDKSKAIKELHNTTVEMYKAQQEAITTGLQNAKLKQEIAKTTIEGLTPSLQGADESVIQDVAAYYGLDANMLMGNIKSTAQKADAEMAQKGFRTINPSDANKMRAEGAEVVSYNGRTYAKEPEIKSVTNKGYVDFFKGTKKIASVPLTGGTGGGGSTDEEKLIKDYESDKKEIRKAIAAGTGYWTLESGRKYLMDQYGLTEIAAMKALPY